MRKQIRRKKPVMMNAPCELYDQIETVRRKFSEINGIKLTSIQAAEFFAKNVKPPIIPNLLKNDKKTKKRRSI